MHWITWGTGTPEDKDEIKRLEVWKCDGWLCDLEDIGCQSIFKVIRSDVTLVRMLPTLDLICDMNTDRW